MTKRRSEEQPRLIQPKPADASVLYAGDCLHVLTATEDYVPDGSVDLIYIDPPWNTSEHYVSFWKDSFRVMSFADDFSDTGDYIEYMRPRVAALHRKLKPTGTFYFHCDYHCSHYVKVMLDDIFGAKNLLNEIIWYYRGAGVPKRARARRHDTIFWYARKKGRHHFDADPIRQPYADATQERFKHRIGNVRGDKDYGQQTLNPLGKHPDDVITEIQPIAPSARERLGYPTQKPEELLANLILPTTKEGDLVLDAFCGCGTTIAVANNLNRRWIGIDISHVACRAVAEDRLEARLDLKENEDFFIWGTDLAYMTEAALLEMSPNEFESWAITQLQGQGNKVKTRDGGIDGRYYPIDKVTYQQIMQKVAGTSAQRDLFDQLYHYRPIQVKQHMAPIGRPPIADFREAMKRESVDIGYFVAFGFTKDALKTIKRLHKQEDTIIVPATAKQMVEGGPVEIQTIHAAPLVFEDYLREFERKAA